MKRNKERKNDTKLKLHESTRSIIILISLVLLVISFIGLYTNIFSQNGNKFEKEIYNYSNNYNIDYKVNITKNNFIDEESLPAGQTYLSDLIDSIDTNIKYQYTSSKDTVIKYNYKIDAIIGASYTSNGKTYDIWNKTYNLVDVEDKEESGKISINENLNIDYQKYHKEVKSFKQSMGMTIDAYLYIKLTVNTDTSINEKDIPNQYIYKISVTLGDKVAKVEGNTQDSNTKSIKDTIPTKRNYNIIAIIFNLTIMIGSIYIIYVIKAKTAIYYNIRNEFKLEINRILKSCEDRIVVVKNKIDVEQENTIDVRDFGELIKLSEELYKPVLYWMSENNDEAWFCVISSKIEYRFVLKK